MVSWEIRKGPLREAGYDLLACTSAYARLSGIAVAVIGVVSRTHFQLIQYYAYHWRLNPLQ